VRGNRLGLLESRFLFGFRAGGVGARSGAGWRRRRYRRVMWNILRQVGTHSRSGVDASGWVWEVERAGETRTILVEITGSASATDAAFLAGDTAAAITTEGHSEVFRAIQMDQLPTVIQCGTAGCRVVGPDELSSRR
jgi:hypothetical protein